MELIHNNQIWWVIIMLIAFSGAFLMREEKRETARMLIMTNRVLGGYALAESKNVPFRIMAGITCLSGILALLSLF